MSLSSGASQRLSFLFAAAVAASLVACGGGGAGGNDAQDVQNSGTGGTPAPGPSPSESSAALDDCGLPGFKADALRLLNQYRAAGARCGARGSFSPAAAVAWSDPLAAAAGGHARDMAQNNYFDHTSRDGRSFSDRIEQAGYRWSSAAENISAGQGSVQAAVDGWMKSEGHCANIMASASREIGLACASAAGSTYGRYWVLNLAAPR